MAGQTYTQNTLVSLSGANSLGGRLWYYKLSAADLADTDVDTCAEVKAMAGFFTGAGEKGLILNKDIMIMGGADGDFNIYMCLVSDAGVVTFSTNDVNSAG
jgi:hypothetical protein